MKPDQKRIREVFAEALVKTSAAEREKYLSETCLREPELRQEVEALLAANEQAGKFLNETIALPKVDLMPEGPGSVVGRYKLLQQLGEGGCGVVFMADQLEPVKRRVALKVIKPGMDTKEVLGRFEAERQALALMDHPNIAKVLDAGATATGRPFFVMELVRGIPITRYCDEKQLNTPQRLDLFVQVCQAIQHAHQKGIIHRDIKPSNIMVADYDGTPVPKVIDFGIAKATAGQTLTDKTVFTALEQFIGTPAYMSPEQANLSALDVDTRSDIYSLGVLLYELLTGRTPFDSRKLIEAGLDEIRRVIREEEPPRPSRKLSTLAAEEQTTAARDRQSNPPKLIHLIRGDLDWIVMKCLEKDRNRRYETANGLASDVMRHVNNEPIVARPPSNWYRFQKIAQRHKGPVAAGIAIAAVLVAGIVVSSWQAIRAIKAEQDERAARHVAELSSVEAKKSQQLANRLLYAADMSLAFQAWDDGNFSRLTNLLNAHRPNRGEADRRGFEYFLLQELAKGEQKYVLNGHSNGVFGIAISPDGKWLASRSLTDTRLWDLDRRVPVAVWDSFTPKWAGIGNCALSFSYDSRFIGIETAGGLKLVEVATQKTRLLRTPVSSRYCFSPVTNLVAFNNNTNWAERLYVWDYLADREVVSGDGGDLWQWSADGTLLLTGQGRSDIQWWDAKTLKSEKTEEAVKQFTFGAALSRDGSQMAAADFSGEIRVRRVADGRELARFVSGGTASSVMAFSPDGKYLATPGRTQAIVIWNTTTGQQVAKLRGHRGKVRALAYTPDGKWLASGGEDGEVMLWDPTGQWKSSEVANHRVNTGQNPPCFSPDAKWIAVGAGDEGDDTSILDTYDLHTKVVCPGTIASFSPDSGQFATLLEGPTHDQLQVWQVGAQTNRATVFSKWEHDWHRYLSRDGTLVVLSGQVLDAESGKAILTNSGWDTCLLPDGRSCIGAVSSKINFWDIRARQITRSIDCPRRVERLAISADGKLVAAALEDYSILVWNVDSGTLVGKLSGHQEGVWALAFSPDGQTLASGSMDCTLKLWNLPALREVASFTQEGAVCWITFSPDNQMLAFGGIGFDQFMRAPRGADATPLKNDYLSMSDLPTNSIWRLRDGIWPAVPESFRDAGEDLVIQGRLNETEVRFRQALRLDQQLYPNQPGKWEGSIKGLADTLLRETNFAAAESIFKDTLAAVNFSNRQNLLLLFDRARFYARCGKWEEAIADFSKAIELSPTNTLPYHWLAPILAHRGDAEAYHAHCVRALNMFSGLKGAMFAERIAKVCLILPDPNLDLNAVAKLADEAVTAGKQSGKFPYYAFTKGLAEYRQAHYEDAVAWTGRALEAEGEDSSRDASSYFVLAMAKYRSDHRNEAQDAFEKGAAIIQKEMPALNGADSGVAWSDWLISDALFKEAKALLNPPRTAQK